MIQIDMQMPEACDVCPFNYDFCRCKAFGDDDNWEKYSDDWNENVCERTTRPEYCPLKEQEAVKPYIDIDEAKCPICKVKLTRQELLGEDVLFEDFFDYCPRCGRKVKWL